MSRDQELENIKMCINQNMHKILLTGKIIIGVFLRHIDKEFTDGHYWSYADRNCVVGILLSNSNKISLTVVLELRQQWGASILQS
jgi:hypothetical protein